MRVSAAAAEPAQAVLGVLPQQEAADEIVDEFFRRKIGDIDNTFDILGDRVFRAVVTFTLDRANAIRETAPRNRFMVNERGTPDRGRMAPPPYIP